MEALHLIRANVPIWPSLLEHRALLGKNGQSITAKMGATYIKHILQEVVPVSVASWVVGKELIPSTFPVLGYGQRGHSRKPDQPQPAGECLLKD